jgi:hypothetical protein
VISRRVLFVTNGHGEVAIAACIAAALRARSEARTEHFPLVGAGLGGRDFAEVGPRRVMPSGGLVAMGNVGAFARDLASGWLGLFAAQLRFLRTGARAYDAVVAVGDAYGCALARSAGRPTAFVGTAKSVFVAPYGPLERAIVGGAARVFVRDAATATALRERGVAAEAPGNVIVDLLASSERFAWSAPLRIALLPGSRARAYDDAERLAAAAAAAAAQVPGVECAISIAPTLDPARFAPVLARHPALRPWPGPLGALLAEATLVVGQAGTANEAAAANGVPVVALELEADRRDAWYRRRQVGLLGDALTVIPGELPAAGAALADLLRDEPRRRRMGGVGRERMGGPGGAAAIAAAVAELAAGRT